MDEKTRDLLRRKEKALWPSYFLYYTEPIALERGEGLYVWDVAGNRYLDFFGGILVTSVGHGNPEVVERVKEQIEKIVHTSTLYLHENIIRLGEKLAEIAPGRLSTSFFTNSGTEANETAVMLAKAYTGRNEVIALRNSYSGRSALAMNLTGIAAWRPVGSEIPGIEHAMAPYCYRCPVKSTYPQCGLACAEDVENVIRTSTSGRIAAFIAEPIQGVGGFVVPPPDYFQAVAEIVRRYDGLIIIDEVQTAFGRTGRYWFGIQHWGIEPDILTTAKGIANGFPLGATITRPDIADELPRKGLSISTFGGNPVSSAAAIATIEVLQAMDAPAHVEKMGAILREGLDQMAEKYPIIGDVRGMGLMQGVELVADRKTKEPSPQAAAMMLDETKARGLLIGKGGAFGNVLRIAPPLTATEEHIREALEILDHAFAAVQDALG